MSDTVRQKSTELLSQALSNNESLAKEIEQAIYELNPQVDTAYKDAIRSHVFNLKDTSNPALKEKVLQRSIHPSIFAEMDASDMASLDRRQSNEILRRSSLMDSLDTEHARPMERDLDDPDAYHD
ncbi:transcription factor S-II, central domain-domain-containing protein [Absidia repens]|uniref:Transcription factor S-II, central domain-domain-containing protein n=1 Tax=Absidia repens TaxID=90262 RepID=A0A1X2ITP8_9FUNG|nr:transcription factor S-II, central domain-domain-containing protein [Absidia repens]